jgi:hypothetical protein
MHTECTGFPACTTEDLDGSIIHSSRFHPAETIRSRKEGSGTVNSEWKHRYHLESTDSINPDRNSLSNVVNASNEPNDAATGILVPADSSMAENTEESTAASDALPVSSELASKLSHAMPANGTKVKKRTRTAVKNIKPTDGVPVKTEVVKEASARKVSRTCKSDKENVPEDNTSEEVMMEDY